MTTYFRGSPQQRTLEYGNQVNGGAKTLPATTTANLFTVSGGRVIVTGMVGQVTTLTGATATTVSIGLTPTTGTANNTGLATATAVTSREVGTLMSVSDASPDGALVVGANAGAAVSYGGLDQVVQPGTITWTTSATDTGAVSWTLTYIVLDDGASVVAL